MEEIIKIAKGEKKAALVLKNANIVNVFTNEINRGDVAIEKGRIVALGSYEGRKEIDLTGRYLAPGFIDSHIHIESSMVTPGQFAKAVLPHGVTSVIADPHEIANVKGLEGIRYMLAAGKDLPLDIYIMLPSCVPSTPFENAGALLEAADLAELMDEEGVLGLGEMMNYPGVIGGDEKVLAKLRLFADKIIDGHGPLLVGKDLNAYVAGGIQTEHECSTGEEMLDRLRLGLYIHIREGSAAKNLKTLLPVVSKDNLSRCLFCTDDKNPRDLLRQGSIDHNIRLAVKEGFDPIDAIKMASWNTAQAYKLADKGAVAPGYRADLVVLDNLHDFNVVKVFKAGLLVAENNRPFFRIDVPASDSLRYTVNIKDVSAADLAIPVVGEKVNVIKLVPHSIITEKSIRSVKDGLVVEAGNFLRGDDLLKVAVIERHRKTGNIGLALVEGFGLTKGAIASTVAHDSHNLIVIGANDEDMLLAIKELKRVGGGLAIAAGGKILATLELPIGGLMSEQALEEVVEKLDEMLAIAYDQLQVKRDFDPFMTLAFIALPVIPELKVTDMGLFDVNQFKFIDLVE